MLKFRYLPIGYNSSSRKGQRIKYLAIHDTGNTKAGANAYNHYKYFGGGDRQSSAHYFVDDKEIVQIVADSRASWAVGDNQGYGVALNGVTNYNSISIELCINSDGNYQIAYRNLVELVKNLMVKFNIPLSNVCRHYDVSRKRCPGTFFPNNWTRWKEFLVDIQKPMKIKLDLDKDSIGVEVGTEIKPPIVVEPEKPVEDTYYKYYEVNDLMVLETKPENIYTQYIGGKTLHQVGAIGINGGFFSGSISTPNSICSIMVNNGKIIGPNAYTNEYNHPEIKRGTMVFYEDGQVTVQYINNINELTKPYRVVIGGVALWPSYDMKYEKAPSNWLRKTNHSGIAYAGRKIHLIVSRNCTMAEFKNRIIKTFGDKLVSAIAVDGGGSTQMFVPNGGMKSSDDRRIPSIIGVKKG